MEFNATFIISAVSFILFTFIMNKIFYKPIEHIINERQRFIEEKRLDAENSRQRMNAILDERDKKLSKSAQDSKKLMSDKVNSANETAKIKTYEAKQKSQQEINNAKANLISEADKASEELRNKVKDLAEIISSKVLGVNTKIECADNDIINRILN